MIQDQMSPTPSLCRKLKKKYTDGPAAMRNEKKSRPSEGINRGESFRRPSKTHSQASSLAGRTVPHCHKPANDPAASAVAHTQ